LDDRATIAELSQLVRQFVSEREWQVYQDPKNLSSSIAIEAAELVEIFQWLTNAQSWDAGRSPDTRQHIREELADVVIYCLALANALDIDLDRAIREKMVLNAEKYPIETSRGRL
jgi:NTP pyrophosphatase (non-canonical NTP hydrolase)